MRKLDRYNQTVHRLLLEGVRNVVGILREIQADVFEGGYSMLREYMALKCALRAGGQTVRFGTRAGHELRSDWGEVSTVMAGQERKVFVIVNEQEIYASIYKYDHTGWVPGDTSVPHAIARALILL